MLNLFIAVLRITIICKKITSLLYQRLLDQTIFDEYLEGIRVMVFNATFNNISVISWRPVLLVEETRVPWENQRPAASHWQTLSHNVVSSTSRHKRDSNSQLLVEIGTDCTGSCKSNYHTITTMTALKYIKGQMWIQTTYIVKIRIFKFDGDKLEWQNKEVWV